MTLDDEIEFCKATIVRELQRLADLTSPEETWEYVISIGESMQRELEEV